MRSTFAPTRRPPAGWRANVSMIGGSVTNYKTRVASPGVDINNRVQRFEDDGHRFKAATSVDRAERHREFGFGAGGSISGAIVSGKHVHPADGGGPRASSSTDAASGVTINKSKITWQRT